MGDGGIAKVLIALLFLGNIGYLGYNGLTYFDEIRGLQTQVEKSPELMQRLQTRYLKYRRDLKKIVRNKYVQVKDVNVALDRQAKRVQIRPLDDGLIIPLKFADSRGRRFDEQLWKLSFRERKKTFSARTLAQFCRNIEKDMPGYQIKSVDLGKREAIWGSDQWQPNAIIVRRLSRKKKK